MTHRIFGVHSLHTAQVLMLRHELMCVSRRFDQCSKRRLWYIWNIYNYTCDRYFKLAVFHTFPFLTFCSPVFSFFRISASRKLCESIQGILALVYIWTVEVYSLINNSVFVNLCFDVLVVIGFIRWRWREKQQSPSAPDNQRSFKVRGNFFLFSAVKEFRKSVKIWQSYCQQFGDVDDICNCWLFTRNRNVFQAGLKVGPGPGRTRSETRHSFD